MIKKYLLGLLFIALLIQPYFVGSYLVRSVALQAWFDGLLLEMCFSVLLALPYMVGNALVRMFNEDI